MFAVETDKVCIVPYDSYAPLPKELIPDEGDLSSMGQGFAHGSNAFETIFLMLFIVSITTSILYIIKVIRVC